MRWKLIGRLTLAGGLLILPAFLGWYRIEAVQICVWLGFALFCSVVIGRAGGRPVLAGLVLGVLVTLLQRLILFTFWEQYAAHNFERVAGMIHAAPELNPRYLILLALLAHGPAYGLLIGLLAWPVAIMSGTGSGKPGSAPDLNPQELQKESA